MAPLARIAFLVFISWVGTGAFNFLYVLYFEGGKVFLDLLFVVVEDFSIFFTDACVPACGMPFCDAHYMALLAALEVALHDFEELFVVETVLDFEQNSIIHFRRSLSFQLHLVNSYLFPSYLHKVLHTELNA